MWHVTADKTLAGCGRWRAPGAAAVGLEYGGKSGARFLGVQNSHSVWGSPLAAVAIMRERARTVEGAVEEWLDGAPGRAVAVFTGTVQHSREQALSDVWNNLSTCWQGVTGHRAWKGKDGARRRHGVAHFFKSVETTVGQANGWHVHQHTLFYLERALSEDELNALEGTLYSLWSAAAVRKGYRAPSRAHGVDLIQTTAVQDAGRVAAYVTKGMTWGAAAEVTGGALKDAKAGNRTPFQILDDIAAALAAGEEPNPQDVALWREWEKGSKGRHQSGWSHGAKAALKVDEVRDEDVELDELMEEPTPEEELEEGLEEVEEREPHVVAVIDAAAWSSIQSDTDSRRELLRYVADAPDVEQARRRAHLWLMERGLAHESVCAPVDTGPAPWAHRVDREAARAVLKEENR